MGDTRQPSVGRDPQPVRHAPHNLQPIRLRINGMLSIRPPLHYQLHSVPSEL